MEQDGSMSYLDRLDQVSETERNYIINYYNSLLPKCSIKWKDNVLYVTCSEVGCRCGIDHK